MYYNKWRPNKAQAKAFAETIETISRFCTKHNIETSINFEDYTFSVRGIKYHVSPHATKMTDDTIHITASKTRIIEIYNDLAMGYKLNGRGQRI